MTEPTHRRACIALAALATLAAGPVAAATPNPSFFPHRTAPWHGHDVFKTSVRPADGRGESAVLAADAQIAGVAVARGARLTVLPDGRHCVPTWSVTWQGGLTALVSVSGDPGGPDYATLLAASVSAGLDQTGVQHAEVEVVATDDRSSTLVIRVPRVDRHSYLTDLIQTGMPDGTTLYRLELSAHAASMAQDNIRAATATPTPADELVCLQPG